MRFIEVDDGFINLAFVARIKQAPIGQTVKSIFYGADGERLGEHMGEVTQAGLNALVVPAPPGYVVVGVSVDEEGTYIFEDDVLAFHLDTSEYGLVPYTIDGSPRASWPSAWAIRTPAGKLVCPGDTTFESLDEFVATVVKRFKAEQERSNKEQVKAIMK